MQGFLEARVHGDEHPLKIRTLLNEQASRQAIIDAFRDHLSQAREGDTALFCFCGHGSQTPTAPELHYLEPDRLDETLVCHDSRREGVYDLADKELSTLIQEVASHHPHVVLILDSCHSGTASRSIESTNAEIGVRRVPTDTRQRPFSSYLMSVQDVPDPSEGSRSPSVPAWTSLDAGKHVILSACQADEEAKEVPFDGQTRGVFSWYLQSALQSNAKALTYRDLFTQVSAQVRSRVSRQSPRIEVSDPADLDRPFLGDAVQAAPSYYSVHHEIDAWYMDAGSIHGIPPTQGEETTHLALYTLNTNPDNDDAVPIGTARVREVQSGRSKLAITLADNSSADTGTSYRAVITALPLPPKGVRLEGDENMLAKVREQLVMPGLSNAPSLLLQEVNAGEAMTLIAENGRYRIRRSGDDRPLSAVIEPNADSDDDALARHAVDALEHIARWVHMLELHNPATQLPGDAIGLELHRVDGNGQATPVDTALDGCDVRLHYSEVDGQCQHPSFRLKVINRSQQTLHCVLLDLTDRFRISAQGLFPGGSVTLAPDEEVWAMDGRNVPVNVPDELWEQGLTEYKDVIKVIAATERFDANRFEQGNLGMHYEPDTARSVGTSNALEKLMSRSMTRDLDSLPTAGDKRLEWTTTAMSLTTIRPLDRQTLPDSTTRSVELTAEISIAGHERFRATARLATEPLASRDMSSARPMPTWLRDDPSIVMPLDLARSRNVEAGLSVIELDAVENPEAVTREKPLRVEVNTTLAENEHVLAIAYDESNQLYLPVGHGSRQNDKLVVNIERLPEPAISSRSIGGSIKIFFKKIISKVVGTEFEYPILAAVDRSGKRNSAVEPLKQQVAAANRILLYIHGIVGNTETMAESAFQAIDNQTSAPIGAQYDLVLTFDYENLNTHIQENGKLLGQRLAAVGLDQKHGKTLHIVAHSMGGLVSRWFIEREGGKHVVSHLVMLGTPNLGSPWSTVENYVAGALGIGLNRLSAVIWPVKILSVLARSFERAAGQSLEQMGNGSTFLDELAASDDPGVPYSIIAGSTSLIADATRETDEKPKSLFKRLLGRLNLKQVLDRAATIAFFREPNDIAVTVDSIGSIPAFAKAAPTAVVPCDHMTYFSVDASLSALSAALESADSTSTSAPA